jgi:hypothetical protein
MRTNEEIIKDINSPFLHNNDRTRLLLELLLDVRNLLIQQSEKLKYLAKKKNLGVLENVDWHEH